MKRFCILFFILIILSGCADRHPAGQRAGTLPVPAAESDAAPEQSTSAKESTFTLMWYVNGSDLESGGGEDYGGAFSRNLREVLSYLPADDRVTVVIFSGGTSKWETAGFEADINQVHFVTEDGLSHGERLPEGSIADPDTLAGFVDYVMKARPADRYGLVFWDHGSSVPIGFGLDELREPRSINARDIARGLEAGLGGEKLAFIGFDTCLMATAETAALCAPHAGYMIASEELEPNAGWNYAPLMRALTRDPSVDTLRLCRIVADAYYSASLELNPEELITVSVTDLAKIDAVVSATEAFALAAKSDLDAGGFAGISKRRATVKDFGGVNESADMVDLVHLAQRFSPKYPKESKALIAAVKSCVAYNRRSRTSPNSNGLSVYFPYENEPVMDGYLDVYLAMGFTEAYIGLIRSFSAELRAGDADTKRTEIPVEAAAGGYKISVPDGITSLRAALLGRESGDAYYIFSYVPGAALNGKTGSAALPESWLTLNGVLVCAYTESADERHVLYSVPVLVNGRDMNLMYAREGAALYEIGATPDGDEDTPALPGFLPINAGDAVTPKYPRVSLSSGREEDGYYLGETVGVTDGGLAPEFSALPGGEYYFAFCLTDIYDNHFWSEVIQIT